MSNIYNTDGTTVVVGGTSEERYKWMVNSLYRSLVECEPAHVVVAVENNEISKRIKEDLYNLRFAKRSNRYDASISKEHIFLTLDFVTVRAMVADDIKRLGRVKLRSGQRHYYFFNNTNETFLEKRLLKAMGPLTQGNIKSVISLEHPDSKVPVETNYVHVHNLTTQHFA